MLKSIKEHRELVPRDIWPVKSPTGLCGQRQALPFVVPARHIEGPPDFQTPNLVKNEDFNRSRSQMEAKA